MALSNIDGSHLNLDFLLESCDSLSRHETLHLGHIFQIQLVDATLDLPLEVSPAYSRDQID